MTDYDGSNFYWILRYWLAVSWAWSDSWSVNGRHCRFKAGYDKGEGEDQGLALIYVILFSLCIWVIWDYEGTEGHDSRLRDVGDSKASSLPTSPGVGVDQEVEEKA